MCKKNKILYLSRTSNLGGAEKTLLDLIKSLNKDAYYPIVVLPDSSGLLCKELKKLDIEVIIVRFPFLRVTYNIFLLIWYAIKLLLINFNFYFLLRKNDIKIVVCNSFQDSLFISIPVKVLNKKLVIYVKNILDKNWKKYIRTKICELFSDIIIAVSSKAAEDFNLFSRRKSTVKIIYDGIDIKEFKGNFNRINILKKYPNYNNKYFSILNIGNLSELKGQYLLLESMLTNKLKDVDVQVLFLGDVNYKKDLIYKKKLIDLVHINKLNSKVFFLGYQKDVRSFIYNTDVLVHCPIIDDCFPRVILESLSFGKIVIATRTGGIPEIINDGINGFLCEISKEDLADKILFVYNNMKKLNFIRKNAEETIRKKFNFEAQIKETEKIYEELLN